MKFSIVTPSLNQGRYIGDAIESVASQKGVEVEHIVMDGCSTDETAEVVKGYRSLQHLKWLSAPDDGQSDAINKGLQLATGDIVAWLNADDYYLPDAFGRVAQHFQKNPGVDILYGEAAFVDSGGRTLRVKRDHRFDYRVLLYYGCYIQSTATFFRRGIVDDGEQLDPSYRVAMDHEFFVRLAANGRKFGFIPECLAAFRWHGQNVSSVQSGRRREERLRVIRQYGFQCTQNKRLEEFLYSATGAFYRGKRGLLKLLPRA